MVLALFQRLALKALHLANEVQHGQAPYPRTVLAMWGQALLLSGEMPM
jgi:hypothetical protein